MNHVLPMLLCLGLAFGGCAMAGNKALPRSYHRGHRGRSQPVNESVQAKISLSTRTSPGRSYRASRAASPPSPSLQRMSTGAHRTRASGRVRSRHVVRRVAKTRVVSGRKNPAGTKPVVAQGARIPQARLVIYRGTLVLRIFKLRDAVDLAQKLSLETGAYIQSRNNSKLVIRVPVHRFHELMARLAAVGEVASKSIAARDVTRQYFDVTHRLKADHAVLKRLKSLLLKAKNVQESLLIEREMSRLLTRIERYKGLLRYLQHHASLSTIVLYFRVKPRYSRPIRTSWRSPFGWVKGLGLWRMMRF